MKQNYYYDLASPLLKFLVLLIIMTILIFIKLSKSLQEYLLKIINFLPIYLIKKRSFSKKFQILEFDRYH